MQVRLVQKGSRRGAGEEQGCREAEASSQRCRAEGVQHGVKAGWVLEAAAACIAQPAARA